MWQVSPDAGTEREELQRPHNREKRNEAPGLGTAALAAAAAHLALPCAGLHGTLRVHGC